MPIVPRIEMNDGKAIPQLGWGVMGIASEDMPSRFALASAAGYRLIDTAQAYGNESGVGRAIQASEVAREHIFVTTKLANENQGYDATMRAFDGSMKRLQLDVLDLYLIHWPQPMYSQYVDTWKAFESLLRSGRIKSIGVSNFNQDHLQHLFERTEMVPVVNQVELHPRFPQTALRDFHTKHGILTEAWSPLERGGRVSTPAGSGNIIPPLLEEPVLVKLAREKGRTAAQIVLRWHVELGNVIIPKSSNSDRLRENISIFDFTLDQDDMAQIATLTGDRMGPDPEYMSHRTG